MCNIAGTIFCPLAAYPFFFHLAANGTEFLRHSSYVCVCVRGQQWTCIWNRFRLCRREQQQRSSAASAVADVREVETLNPFCWCVHTTATVASFTHVSQSEQLRSTFVRGTTTDDESYSRASGKYSVRSLNFSSSSLYSRPRPHSIHISCSFSFYRCPAAFVVVVSLPFLILGQKRQREKKETTTNYWKWRKRSKKKTT